jgi:membrane-associated phospholipid phosphatase
MAIVCAMAIRLWTGYPGNPKGETSLTVALLVIALTALARFLLFLWSLWKDGNPHPSAAIKAALPAATLGFIPIAIGVITIGSFLVSISYLKSMITVIVPFWADGPLAATDRMMSIDAQSIALAVAPALPAIGIFYGLWHLVNLGGILWVLQWRSADKASHIIGYMLTWAIGMFFAYLISSAGPIFTGLYDPAVAPESVRKPAAILWANYQARGALIGGGISAFPSLHVAIAAWFALVLRHRGLGWIGFSYAIGVLASSVILGWHYVLDGVAGIGIAIFSYWLAAVWTAPKRSDPKSLGQPASVFC